MSSALAVFEFGPRELRTILIGGEPWFVAADICAALGIGNTRQAVSHLDEDEVQQVPVTTNDGSSRELPTNIVNEAGLYSLILRSRKPEAKTFKRWITHEVLPAIRQTGSYSMPTQRAIPSSRELALLVIAEADRADAAEALAEQRADQLAEAAPRVATLDAIEAGEGMTTRAYRKTYFPDITEREFFAHLYHRGYLINQAGSGSWDDRNKRYRDGSQHGHPGAVGNPYFYLHSQLDRFDVRRYHARVRPGEPEIKLRDPLIRQGLTPKLITDADLERNAE